MGKETVDIQAVTLDKLDGGLNSNWLSSSMQDNESRDCSGFIWMDNCLQPTPGWVRLDAQLGGTGSTGHVNGIVDYRMRDGTQYRVVAYANKVYYWNVATYKYVDITGAAHVTTDNLTRMIVFNNRVLGTNGVDTIFDWIPGGDLLELSAACGADIPPASAKYIATFNGRVVFLNYMDGATRRSTRAAFSLPDNQNHYDLTFDFWEVDGDDGDEITGGSQLGNDFIIFTNNTINIISGSGTPWTVTRGFIRGVGCVSGDSVSHTHIWIGGNLIECLTFMSHDGPKAFDGSAVHSLPILEEGRSYKCQAYFDTINAAYKQNSLSVYYPRRNWIMFAQTSATATTNDIGSYCSPDTNSLWPFKNVRAHCLSRIWNPSTHTHDIYIGSSDGCIYYLSETDKSLEASTELVVDGSMEVDPATNWPAYGTPTTRASDGNEYQGAASIKIVTDAINEGCQQTITTVAGSKYRVHAWAYVDTGTVKCTAGGVVGSTLTAAVVWQKIKVDFVATSTTSTIIFNNPSTAVSTYYIDDVSCRCIDIAPYWESRYFDVGDESAVKYLREIVPFVTSTTGGNITILVTYDKGAGGTGTDTLTVTSGSIDWALLDWTAVDWTSTEETSFNLESITQDSFRTFKIRIQAGPGMTNCKFNKLIMSIKEIGKRWFAV